MDEFDEQEPTEEELIEMQRMLDEDNEKETEELLSNRIYYQYTSFSYFRTWLSENGIRW